MTLSRGEVWLVNLDPTIADEIRKTRPAVIVSRDTIGVLALRVVVPLTAWQPQFQGPDWLVRLDPDALNALDKPCAADTLSSAVGVVAAFRSSRRTSHGCGHGSSCRRPEGGVGSITAIHHKEEAQQIWRY